MVGTKGLIKFALVLVALGLLSPGVVDAKRKRPKRKAGPKIEAPKYLVLGKDKNAVIKLRHKGAAVEFYTNVGKIVSSVAKQGSVEAIYEPPEGGFPQVAIIVAASSDRSLLEWVTIPLHGQPNIQIKSIRRADVIALVGDQKFGPVRTDNSGNARLQVIVPPGLQRVALTTTDRLGSVSKSSTPLNAAEFSRVFALCPTGDADDVFLFATQPSSAALKKATFKIKSSIALAKPRKLKDGVFAVKVPMAPATETQTFDLRASLSGSAVSVSSCQGKRPGLLPVAMKLLVSSESYTAGSGSPIELSVKLDYENEQLRRRPILVSEPSIGSVSEFVRRSDTEFVAQWALPDGFKGLKGASVSVRSEGQADLHSETKVELKAAAASTIALWAKHGALPADGTSTTKIIATVKDAFGNAVAGSTLESPAAKNLSAFAPASEPGRYVATYTAQRSYDATNESLVVRDPASGIEGRLVVGLVPIKKSIVADLRFGYMTNLGVIKAPSGSLALAYRISIGDHYALVGANATLYRSKSTESTDDGSSLELSVLGAPVVATLGYERVLRNFSIFVGGGGGVVYSRTDLSSMSTGSRRVAKYSPGGGAFLGTRLPLGPGHVVAQASYWVAKINDEGVSGNLLGLAVDLGYGFDL